MCLFGTKTTYLWSKNTFTGPVHLHIASSKSHHVFLSFRACSWIFPPSWRSEDLGSSSARTQTGEKLYQWCVHSPGESHGVRIDRAAVMRRSTLSCRAASFKTSQRALRCQTEGFVKSETNSGGSFCSCNFDSDSSLCVESFSFIQIKNILTKQPEYN